MMGRSCLLSIGISGLFLDTLHLIDRYFKPAYKVLANITAFSNKDALVDSSVHSFPHPRCFFIRLIRVVPYGLERLGELGAILRHE